MTNRKLHMHFQLSPRPWMTLNCYKNKIKFSLNFT